MGNSGPGNKSKHWNQEVVSAACKELLAQGVNPTVRTVRSHLKIEQGSDSTIQKYIRIFKTDLPELDETPAAPEPLMTALSSLWEQALTAAKGELASELKKLEEDRKAFRDEQLAVEESLADMESKLRLTQEGKESAERDLQEMAAVLENQTGAIKDLSQELADQSNEIARYELELNASSKDLARLDDQILMLNQLLGNKRSSEQDIFNQRLDLLIERVSEHLPKTVLKELKKTVEAVKQ